MGHSVRSHLRVEVDAYDAGIRTFIPGYETLLAKAAEAVAAARPARVADLGAGTGALSQAILERCPDCHVELIDADAQMLDQARARLAGYGGRASFSRRLFQDALPRCDAVAASLALHHVPTLGEKRALFARIHDALAPGGVFVNADAGMPADADLRAADYRTWAAHLIDCGIPEARAWRHFEEWAEEDVYLPLDDELAALHAVGFDAQCLWRKTPVAVVRAVKGVAPAVL